MPYRDTSSWNTMLAVFSHSGDITTTISLFDAMPNPDAVSWNALISSYCQHIMYQESSWRWLALVLPPAGQLLLNF
jgi:pentatricopeptide repeat protein